jgi:hypothetical protein
VPLPQTPWRWPATSSAQSSSVQHCVDGMQAEPHCFEPAEQDSEQVPPAPEQTPEPLPELGPGQLLGLLQQVLLAMHVPAQS